MAAADLPMSAASQGKQGDFDVVEKVGTDPINELGW